MTHPEIALRLLTSAPGVVANEVFRRAGVKIKYAAKVLRRRGIKIETVRGLGYRLVRPVESGACH